MTLITKYRRQMIPVQCRAERARRQRPTPGILADIVLGMPKHDCRFHGICRIEPAVTNPEASLLTCMAPERIKAYLLFTDSEHCAVSIPRNQLPPHREAYHFNRGFIRLWSDAPLTALRGAAHKNLQLASGSYPLWITPGHYHIMLPIVHNHTY